jgi:hypothetical protein
VIPQDARGKHDCAFIHVNEGLKLNNTLKAFQTISVITQGITKRKSTSPQI